MIDPGQNVNSVDPDQNAPEEHSDQGLHCLLKIVITSLNRDENLQSF